MLGAAFIVQQRRSLHPVVDLKYFRSADFSLLNIGSMTLNLGAFAIWLFVPFYLDRSARLPLGAVGLVLAIGPVGTAIAAPIAGRFAGKMNARRLAVAGAVAVATGGLIIGIDVGGVTLLALAALLQGLGLGSPGGIFRYRDGDMPAADRGVAGSLVMMTRTLGIVIGATVLTLVFQRLSVDGRRRRCAARSAASMARSALPRRCRPWPCAAVARGCEGSSSWKAPGRRSRIQRGP